jgi:hypothetical protein
MGRMIQARKRRTKVGLELGSWCMFRGSDLAHSEIDGGAMGIGLQT